MAAENFKMAQALQPGLPQHYVPSLVYQLEPYPLQAAPYARVPDAIQRRLNIRHFDIKELY